MAKATSLIKAYMNETIPSDGGFIISGFFQPGSNYAIYEVTAYRNVKDIYRTGEGLTFKTDGNRCHMLVEPAIYSGKHLEPVNREAGRSIPYRFGELSIMTAYRKEKIMIAKEPIMLYASFTVLQKESDYFAFLFYPTQDVYMAIKKFIADSLYNDCSIAKKDAVEASETLLATIKKFTVWQG